MRRGLQGIQRELSDEGQQSNTFAKIANHTLDIDTPLLFFQAECLQSPFLAQPF